MKRRLLCAFLAVVMAAGMLSALSASATTASAAAKPQAAMWFMDYVSITQPPGGDYSHMGTQNFDVGHGGLIHANIKAPFDCKIVKIHTGSGYGNTVIIESLEPVLYADGTVDYMSMAFGHDNDVSDLTVGQTLVQGQVFYQTGTKDASAAHAHVTCIKGKYKGDMWVTNSYGNSCSPNAISPTTALFIPEGITVTGTKGLTFVTYNPCDHTYEVKNDVAVCSKCPEVYVVPQPTGGEAYMDIVDQKTSKGAAAHKTPYGEAAVTNYYKKGQTVCVRGSVVNAYGKTWYQLTSGEWIYGEYLGEHMHCWSSKGFCTHCRVADEVNGQLYYYHPIWMGTVPIKVKSGQSAPVHFAPYGDSLKFATCSGSIKVDAKVVNGHKHDWYRLADGPHKGGWIYGAYLDSGLMEGIVNLSALSVEMMYGPGTDSDGYFAVGVIPPRAKIKVYTKEVSEQGPEWYSVRYGDIVGFVPKYYIMIPEDSRYIEVPFEEAETGGSTENVPTYTGGSSTPSGGGTTPSTGPTGVYVYYPSDPAYIAKFAVSNTSATVVANILKPAGSRVTACGLLLYDSSANLLKNHNEAVSNVPNSMTSFHAWYDIQSELGLTLTPGTTYLYKFYTVVDGVTYEQGQYSFTTTGPAPAPQPEPEQPPARYNLFFDANGGACDTASKSVEFNTAVGELPTPTREGYTFTGWYMGRADGGKVGETTRFNVECDVILYAHWSPKKYTLIFESNGGVCLTRYKTVTYDSAIGEMPIPTRSGYTFDGWYTVSGGRVGAESFYRANGDVTLYARWSLAGAAAMQDVPANKWYFKAVDYVIKNGLMNGYDATTFAPGDNLTRAMLVQILYNREGKPAVAGNAKFTDVPATKWYASAVEWASTEGVVTGYADNTFLPTKNINRQEMAQMLYNYAGRPAVSGDLSRFADADSVAGWAKDAITWAVQNGIMSGKSGGLLDPRGLATRAEAAQMLTNFVTKVN